MCKLLNRIGCRLISVEDVRNYFSHITHNLIFDFFLNFLIFKRQVRFNANLYYLGLTKV